MDGFALVAFLSSHIYSSVKTEISDSSAIASLTSRSCKVPTLCTKHGVLTTRLDYRSCMDINGTISSVIYTIQRHSDSSIGVASIGGGDM